MTIVARLRKAIALVAAGKTPEQAAKATRLGVDDVRLAVVAPEWIDNQAARIAQRMADEKASKPRAQHPRSRRRGVSTDAAQAEPVQPALPVGEPANATARKARAIAVISGADPDDEPPRPPRRRRPAVHDDIARAMQAAVEIAEARKPKALDDDEQKAIKAAEAGGRITVGPTRYARGCLRAAEFGLGLGAVSSWRGGRRNHGPPGNH